MLPECECRLIVSPPRSTFFLLNGDPITTRPGEALYFPVELFLISVKLSSRFFPWSSDTPLIKRTVSSLQDFFFAWLAEWDLGFERSMVLKQKYNQ